MSTPPLSPDTPEAQPAPPRKRFMAVADHPRYPSVEYFDSREDADAWLAGEIATLHAEDGHHTGIFTVAEILHQETRPTLY